jgi:hypothetical protein
MYLWVIMKAFFRQIASTFLLMAFALAIAPKELIHELTGHDDTHHGAFHSDPEISEHHIHCASLGLSLPVFAKTETPEIPSVDVKHSEIIWSIEQLLLQFLSIAPSGRAPPFTA